MPLICCGGAYFIRKGGAFWIKGAKGNHKVKHNLIKCHHCSKLSKQS